MIGRGRGRGRGTVIPGGGNGNGSTPTGSVSSGTSSPGDGRSPVVDTAERMMRSLAVRSSDSDGSNVSSRSASVSESVCRTGSAFSPASSTAGAAPAFRYGPRVLQRPAKLANRPGFGKDGEQINLLANHFIVTLPKEDMKFYHYDIIVREAVTLPNGSRVTREWTGFRLPRHTRDEMRETAYRVFATWAKDKFYEKMFKMIYDRQSHVFTPVFFGRDIRETVQVDNRRFDIILTSNVEAPVVVVSKTTLYQSTYDNPIERDRSPMQVLDILHNQMLYFKHCMQNRSPDDYKPHGRCFYKPLPIEQQRRISFPMGRNLRDGFIKSLRMVVGNPETLEQSGFTLTMNIDVKLSPFFTEQRLDLTASQTLELNQVPPNGLTAEHIALLRRHFYDLRVKTRHTSRIFTIRDVSDKPANRETFLDLDGQMTNVADYFAKKYEALQFPTLPCVVDDAKNFFPLEMCNVLPNQKVDLKKLTAEQSSKIIKEAAVPPEKRLAKIIQKSNELSDNGQDRFLSNLGINRSLQMMKVTGRVLRHPAVQYGNNATLNVRGGSWMLGQQNTLYEPATVRNHIVLCLENQRKLCSEHIDQFLIGLMRKARKMGVSIPERCVFGNFITLDQLESILREWKTQKNVDLAICIMDGSKLGVVKNHVKYCEQKTEVVTQCVTSKTVLKYVKDQRANETLLENVALKINLKCGGINNFIPLNDPVARDWFAKDVMFVGMDVNHPSPLSKKEIAMGRIPLKPSIIGAVANIGRHVANYSMQARAQDARVECIQDINMKSIMKEFINTFEQNRGIKPNRIVVYRDGVSESQFDMVVNKEAFWMKETFAMYGDSYCPKLTVITAQKRHNTRLFRERINERDRAADKNIPAGTVVDTGPVNAFQFEFFLASQAGIQGTTKAPNYVVMCDENGFTADVLQRLTFLLCHVYQRATKSVSLPAPCYFAHHAATRGKELVEGALNMSDDTSSTTSNERSLPNFEKLNEDLIKYSRDFGTKMLFL